MSFKNFLYELYFNFFVGISEEFIFRALLLGGLWYFFDFWKSAVISSLFFSLWHFDVVSDSFYLLFHFTWAMVASVAFASRVGVIALCGVHFVWDQIFFGINWNLTQSGVYDALLLSIDLVAIFILLRYKGPHWQTRKLQIGDV